MTDKVTRLKERTEVGLYAWKVIQAVLGVLALLGLAWTQFLGPGIQPAFQRFSGNTATQEELVIFRDEVNGRLDFIEEFMPAPAVVDWEAAIIRQIGACNSERCVFSIEAARTEFGANCGRPMSIEVIIKTARGQIIRTRYDPTFQPVELGLRRDQFIAPILLPETVFNSPDHFWRTRVTYPTCSGRNEPIPRLSPWFPMNVTGQPT